MKIYEAREDDLIQLTNGEQAKFVKLNRTRFIAVDVKSGQRYSYPISMFVDIADRAVPKTFADRCKWERELEPGKLFYIVNGRQNLLYKFSHFTEKSIVGIVPSDNTKCTIRRGDFEGCVL